MRRNSLHFQIANRCQISLGGYIEMVGLYETAVFIRSVCMALTECLVGSALSKSEDFKLTNRPADEPKDCSLSEQVHTSLRSASSRGAESKSYASKMTRNATGMRNVYIHVSDENSIRPFSAGVARASDNSTQGKDYTAAARALGRKFFSFGGAMFSTPVRLLGSAARASTFSSGTRFDFFAWDALRLFRLGRASTFSPGTRFDFFAWDAFQTFRR